MDDANYPCWLVLVPRIQGAVEVIDLSEAQQEQLWKEVSLASAVVKVSVSVPVSDLPSATLVLWEPR